MRKSRRDDRKDKTTRIADTGNDAADAAYPTDATERERERRKAEKEAGVERTVVKRQKIVEDHHDDCGDCLDSLHLDDEEKELAHVT